MKKFITLSDAGSVKVGNDSFKVLLPNGYGDGQTELIILDQGEKVPEEARFFTCFSGNDIKIYAYDCTGFEGKEVVATISGRYGAFYLDGTVFIERWGEYEE